MATTSDITVADLSAIATARGNKLSWTYSDPRSGALPNIALNAVEVHASTTNDRTTATKVGEGITDFLHAGLIEQQTWYYWIRARDNSGNVGAFYATSPTAGVSATAVGLSSLNFVLSGGSIVPTVSSSALTVAIKTAAGNDPSSVEPVFVSFGNADGTYTPIEITAATSITVASTYSLGTTNDLPFRIWVLGFNDAGTFRLAVINALAPQSVTLDELTERSTQSAGAWNAARVAYSAVTMTSKRYRLLGYLDWNSGLAAAGTWSVGPDVTKLYAVGTAKPGDRINSKEGPAFGFSPFSTVTPWDGTTPQITEGDNINGLTISPVSVVNCLEVLAVVSGDYSVASPIVLALHRDAVNDAVCASVTYCPGVNLPWTAVLHHVFQIGNAGNAFSLRIGGSNAGSGSIGTGGTNNLGGVRQGLFSVYERMG